MGLWSYLGRKYSFEMCFSFSFFALLSYSKNNPEWLRGIELEGGPATGSGLQICLVLCVFPWEVQVHLTWVKCRVNCIKYDVTFSHREALWYWLCSWGKCGKNMKTFNLTCVLCFPACAETGLTHLSLQDWTLHHLVMQAVGDGHLLLYWWDGPSFTF